MKSRICSKILTYCLVCTAAVSLAAQAGNIPLKDGEVAIVIGAQQDVKDIRIYDYDGSQLRLNACKVCPANYPFGKCVEMEEFFCQGTINAVVKGQNSMSVISTLIAHSPDTCCRRVCIGGDCTYKCWTC